MLERSNAGGKCVGLEVIADAEGLLRPLPFSQLGMKGQLDAIGKKGKFLHNDAAFSAEIRLPPVPFHSSIPSAISFRGARSLRHRPVQPDL